MKDFLKDFAVNTIVILMCVLVYPTLKNIIIDTFQFWMIDFSMELTKNIVIIVFLFVLTIILSIIDLMRRKIKKC